MKKVENTGPNPTAAAAPPVSPRSPRSGSPMRISTRVEAMHVLQQAKSRHGDSGTTSSDEMQASVAKLSAMLGIEDVADGGMENE